MGVVVKTSRYKGFSGKWTKWGGRVYSEITNQWDILSFESRDTWACQSCGKDIPTIITPMKYEFPETEYIRVCPLCFADGCVILKKRLENPSI